MVEIKLEAKDENLDTVIDFVNEQLDKEKCSSEIKTKFDIAVEEIFINIAHYAYADDSTGFAVIQMSVEKEPLAIEVTFIDWGTPYNPLERPNPDVTAIPLEKRRNGGMGIYIVKRSMDDVKYQYSDGKNTLTIRKVINS
ncbi:MAG: ATP-binding protein [Clostridia bacterium]|nr:ATP-binding protein [Clostridia bacterium]